VLGVAITSQLKVRLPGNAGTLSVNFFFIMIGLLELDVRQVLLVNCAGTLGKMLWHSHVRPKVVQVVINLACVTVAAYCACGTYHWSVFLRSVERDFEAQQFLARFTDRCTGVFFLSNTLSVSGILAITEGKSLWSVWHESFVWTAAPLNWSNWPRPRTWPGQSSPPKPGSSAALLRAPAWKLRAGNRHASKIR
jgi:hypothetical protein